MLSTLLQSCIVIVMQIKLNVVVVVVGLNNGGRSFAKNMHRKNAFPLGISNSKLACLIIALQQSRRVKNKKMSKSRLGSTLRHDTVNLNQQGKNQLSVLVFVTVFSFLSFTSLLFWPYYAFSCWLIFKTRLEKT